MTGATREEPGGGDARLQALPADLERRATGEVRRALRDALARRGLLLEREALAAADAEASRLGGRLTAVALRRCYPFVGDPTVDVEFGSSGTETRLAAALAFGAAAARVLAPTGRRVAAEDAEVLCALFNLSVGLIDGLCDEAPVPGLTLLDLLRERDVRAAAETSRDRGWLRHALPESLVRDDAAAFAADVVEAFLETLHATYPGVAWSSHRRRVGELLQRALEAERESVAPEAGSLRERLLECSRLTSVLPFLILETLAGGELSATGSPGWLLGEAMWRIDDLVDLCDDARSGALNGILLGAGDDTDASAALERLLASSRIRAAAAEAADLLAAALGSPGDGAAAPYGAPTLLFLSFAQRYAGIAPDVGGEAVVSDSPASIVSRSAKFSTGRASSGGM